MIFFITNLIKLALVLGTLFLLALAIYKLCIYIHNKLDKKEFELRMEELRQQHVCQIYDLKQSILELESLFEDVEKLKKHTGLSCKEQAEEVVQSWEQS